MKDRFILRSFSEYFLFSRTVIPNPGAVKGCQGCRQILNLGVLLIRVPQIVLFIGLRVLPNFFSQIGCREPKKVKKTLLLDINGKLMRVKKPIF